MHLPEVWESEFIFYLEQDNRVYVTTSGVVSDGVIENQPLSGS